MANQTNIQVYFFNDLDNAHLFEDTFNSFSYGDAEVTCVSSRAIVEELLTKDGIDALISEIEGLEKNNDGYVLIAF